MSKNAASAEGKFRYFITENFGFNICKKYIGNKESYP